jgi:plasmid stabilization system protein ParE
MRLEILEGAETELNEAIACYQEIEPGLGVRFKEQVRGTIRWISDNPELPRLRPKGCRRVNLEVFANYVAYDIWADTIWILAIAHARRRPGYWIERKRNRRRP